MTVALILVHTMSALAANSPNTNPVISGNDYDSDDSDDSDASASTGTNAAADTTTGSETSGVTISIMTDAGAANNAGNGVGVSGGNTSAAGTATIGDTQVGMATGEAATAGLPEQTVETIKAINAGDRPLNEIVKDVDLNGYSALTSVQAIVTKDPVTNQVKTGDVAVTLYVPNLIQGIGEVQVLFYENATGLWKLINPANIDVVNKRLTVSISGSGSFSVVYKK